MLQIYIPNCNTILNKRIQHLNVFCALGDQPAPIFLQYHYYEVVLIHEVFINTEALHHDKVMHPEEPW